MRADYGPNNVSVRLAFRPFVDMFQFRGRSTRSEVVSFWLLGLLSQAVHFVRLDLPSTAERLIATGWVLLWAWPWIPLLVRRAHDQDRTGQWGWLTGAIALLFAVEWRYAPAGYGFDISFDWGWVRASRSIAWTPFTAAIVALELVIGLTLLSLYLTQGTAGRNRYGPDPRVDSKPAPILAET